MSDTPERSTRGIQELELPLRGLAGEGAAEIVTPRLMAVSGVIAVDVESGAFRVRVTYDPERATREQIDNALHSLGVGQPHPHDDADGART